MARHSDNAEALAKLDLNWTIIRPSVVYTPRGSYGGASLLWAIAVVGGFMVATLVAYTVFLGFFLPSTWLEPLWWFDQKYTTHSSSFGYGGVV
ncbi:MAG: hypothetical protein GXP09_13115 [Gammaproteobacteria bacterium]|nr:hypothetical protein [Gammaproteobacteria bacterium]